MPASSLIGSSLIISPHCSTAPARCCKFGRKDENFKRVFEKISVPLVYRVYYGAPANRPGETSLLIWNGITKCSFGYQQMKRQEVNFQAHKWESHVLTGDIRCHQLTPGDTNWLKPDQTRIIGEPHLVPNLPRCLSQLPLRPHIIGGFNHLAANSIENIWGLLHIPHLVQNLPRSRSRSLPIAAPPPIYSLSHILC